MAHPVVLLASANSAGRNGSFASCALRRRRECWRPNHNNFGRAHPCPPCHPLLQRPKPTTSSWSGTTSDGKTVIAKFVVLATGCLSNARMPDIKGLDRFKGKVYHTGHWPHEPVDFTGQRVAVIGTGSSGIQSVPVIADQAKHLTVFQRTANV